MSRICLNSIQFFDVVFRSLSFILLDHTYLLKIFILIFPLAIVFVLLYLYL